MQFEVHQRRTTPNLTVAVEQDFALPADGFLFLLISRIKNIGARLRHAVSNEDVSRQPAKIIRPLARHWLVSTSNKQNFRTETAQSPRQQSRDAQRQITLLNGLAVADLKPTLLDFRPAAPKMSGVECDF